MSVLVDNKDVEDRPMGTLKRRLVGERDSSVSRNIPIHTSVQNNIMEFLDGSLDDDFLLTSAPIVSFQSCRCSENTFEIVCCDGWEE